jgi:hypothetical protein
LFNLDGYIVDTERGRLKEARGAPTLDTEPRAAL